MTNELKNLLWLTVTISKTIKYKNANDLTVNYKFWDEELEKVFGFLTTDRIMAKEIIYMHTFKV